MSVAAQRIRPVSADRVREVDLHLERRVGGAGGQRAVDGAAHRGVEQRGGEAAVHDADRVVVELAGRDGEHGAPLLDLDELEAEQDGDLPAMGHCPACRPAVPAVRAAR
jgi:hypothetical protein